MSVWGESLSKYANSIFRKSIESYHIKDNVNIAVNNPYSPGSLEFLLFKKNSIDLIQWHLEDIIRDMDIDPVYALSTKRRIDALNQERTDIVETIDDYFQSLYKDVVVKKDAYINSETPAWAIDRLSILAIKIYHMKLETTRKNASVDHINSCINKLTVLQNQQTDLFDAIDKLIADIKTGDKYMKTYKQMKMYNDPLLNPVLYNKK